MNRLTRLIALLGGCLVAAAANATVSLQFSKIGFTEAELTSDPDRAIRIRFTGTSDGAGNPARPFNNISGSVVYQLIGVQHTIVGANTVSAWTIGAKITNTSVSPMSSARISAVGFSTAAGGATGDNPAFLAITGTPTIAGPLFDEIIHTNSSSGLNIPNVAGSNGPQVCLKTGTQGSGCAGGSGDGLQMGSGANLGSASNPFPSTSSEFVLNFTGPTARTAITLHNLVLRFQSLSGTGQSGLGNGTLDGDSGVGIVTSVDVIPEPSSWAMLIAGFGLIGSAARRRRAVVA
jgi:hypothetical protein